MVIGEAIQRVQSLYSKGVQSDDTRLSSRHIYAVMLSVRARVIIEKLDKGKIFSEWNVQPLHKVAMKRVHLTNSKKCVYMKSVDPLPKGISNDRTEGVTVTSYDGGQDFSRTTFENAKRIGGNRYSAHRNYQYIHDDYLYIVNNRLPFVYVHGIWYDPAEVYRLHLKNQGKPYLHLNIGDIDFYTPEQFMENIIRITKDELIIEFTKMKEDKTNNTNDD